MADTKNNQAKNQTINITPAAVAEIKRLMAEEKEAPLYLRLGVAAGGCSGMSYTMAFDSTKQEFDREFQFDGLSVLVDVQSIMYLNGTTLDFHNGLMGGGFNFSNPNAQRSCGCGSSFTC